jgi:hypothetical protein
VAVGELGLLDGVDLPDLVGSAGAGGLQARPPWSPRPIDPGIAEFILEGSN